MVNLKQYTVLSRKFKTRPRSTINPWKKATLNRLKSRVSLTTVESLDPEQGTLDNMDSRLACIHVKYLAGVHFTTLVTSQATYS